MECDNWKQVSEFIQWVKSGGAKQFKTIVFDDLTEMASLYLTQAMAATKHGQQAYGMMADEILGFIREIRKFKGVTVIMICKQERIQNEAKELLYAPMIPGRAVNPLLSYLVGQIYHMETWTADDGVVHDVLRCKRNSTCEAGDRSGKLSEIEFANLGEINRKVMS